MQVLNSIAVSHAARYLTSLIHSGARLLAGLALGLAIPSLPASATTLYKCKLDGKTVFSDTDCPREVRIKKEARTAKPRVIRIRQKSTSAKSG